MRRNVLRRPWPALLAILLFLLMPGRLHAWCPLAHFILTRDSLGEDAARFANLPDAWTSQTYTFPRQISVTTYFCWSHGVKDNGTIRNGTLQPAIPLAPTYADDGREPGAVMLHFVDSLLDFQKNDWGDQSWLRTACLGFISHNAADRDVHWAVFKAAYVVQGLCLLQWMEKRMGIRSGFSEKGGNL